MRIVIRIDFDSDALQGQGAGAEAARILSEQIAEDIREASEQDLRSWEWHGPFELRDLNGNGVGEWWCERQED